MTAQEVADDFLSAARDTSRKGPPCSVGVMLRSVEDGLRAKVEQALSLAADRDNDEYTYASVSRALKERNVADIKPDTLSRHWRRECGCE